MSHQKPERPRITLPTLATCKAEGRPIVMTTAYDSSAAIIADAAGVDMILVGDSVGNVCLGFGNTLNVSMAMMLHHLQAVARTNPRAFLICDMPFLSYHLSTEDSLRNAGALIQAGAQAVKLEGGSKRLPAVKAMIDADIPVMAHLGLTPQSIHAMGGYKVQAREQASIGKLLEDALRMQDAGCFSILLEGIPAEVAAKATEILDIPTIGIGAGKGCSGQVLVFHDILGLIPGELPRFVRKYMEGYGLMVDALSAWAKDVRGGAFPDASESYTLLEPAREFLDAWCPPPET